MKSVLLLAGFPFVLPTICFALMFSVLAAFDQPQAFSIAAKVFAYVFGVVILATAIWLPIGYLINQWMIDQATGARLVGRDEEPRLWTIYEALCRRCGMRMPALRIIETDALNAFASGLKEGEYSVTVTRGLLDALDDAEIEGVLAHEIAHIRNQDCRMMVVATILVGLIPIIHDVTLKTFWAIVMTCLSIYRGVAALFNIPLLRLAVDVTYGLFFLVCKGIAYGIGAVGHFCSLLIHFSLSREREFLADAGAVELTGNPDALISALRKVSCNSEIATSIEGVREMLFENSKFGSLFATHPPIEKRIAALASYRAADLREPPAPPMREGFARQTPPEDTSPSRRDPPRDDRPRLRVEPRFEPPPTVAPPVAAKQPTALNDAAIDGYRRLLDGAMDGLPERLAYEERLKVYERVRGALSNRLAAMDPPIADVEVERLWQALETAIHQLESQIGRR